MPFNLMLSQDDIVNLYVAQAALLPYEPLNNTCYLWNGVYMDEIQEELEWSIEKFQEE